MFKIHCQFRCHADVCCSAARCTDELQVLWPVNGSYQCTQL